MELFLPGQLKNAAVRNAEDIVTTRASSLSPALRGIIRLAEEAGRSI